MATKTLRITLVRSPIGYNKRQRTTAEALGLTRLGSTVLRQDLPHIRGMVNQIVHLVQVEELPPQDPA